MRLGDLMTVLPDARLEGDMDIDIGQVVCDSRMVEEGDLFVAIRGGEEEDRHLFVPDAVARNAGAIVVEERLDTGDAARVVVDNCRYAAARLAARFHNYPGRELTCVGITGTNGKTTTGLLLQKLFQAAGSKCGYIGTLGVQVGGKLEKGANTTPEAADIQLYLREMVDSELEAAVIEVSSHALALGRVDEIGFDVGLFTNLTRDHLDFHETEREYFDAKAKLLEQLPDGSRAVINIDDPAASELVARTNVPVFSFGYAEGAQIRAIGVEKSEIGMRLRLLVNDRKVDFESQLTGKFNCYNVMAAVACGVALQANVDDMRAGISSLESVPGRFERIRSGQVFELIVDYAHTPAALEIVLQAARELSAGKLICVFGCGGDRDRGKRPLMGKVADETADYLFITSDNPRSESPEAIMEEIVAGVRRDVRCQPDRREAIREALVLAASGDVVVVAGKGHELGQDLGNEVIDFDDRQVCRELLQELKGRF